VRVTEERDGKFLLNDPEYPFESLKKHGQRFASHFRLKKVNSAFLKNLALIDTPGMLDSITERDRGYNYQEVIGDLAQIADLVLILFDPHKAGTVREAHTSLRDTLPSRTFEDRVLFVLNRIDECTSLIDLLQVYGTLCWNLSQMTGRKDIPTIHLTYSPSARSAAERDAAAESVDYLRHLENQREELKAAISEAPRFRLDNLATFVETHSERLAHLLEGLLGYRRRMNASRVKFAFFGLFAALLTAAAGLSALLFSGLLPMDHVLLLSAGGVVAGGIWLFWLTALMRVFTRRQHRKLIRNMDQLTPLQNQTRRDSWESVKELARSFLEKSGGQLSLSRIRSDYDAIRLVHDKGCREIREALNELATLGRGDVEAESDHFGSPVAGQEEMDAPDEGGRWSPRPAVVEGGVAEAYDRRR
jgi:hypothetical protein